MIACPPQKEVACMAAWNRTRFCANLLASFLAYLRLSLIQFSHIILGLPLNFFFQYSLFSCLFYMNPKNVSKGAFHLPELTGQTIPVVMRILLLIKTIQPDPSNPKYYSRRRWFFSKNSWEKFILLSKWLLEPWTGRPVLTFGKGPKFPPNYGVQQPSCLLRLISNQGIRSSLSWHGTRKIAFVLERYDLLRDVLFLKCMA